MTGLTLPVLARDVPLVRALGGRVWRSKRSRTHHVAEENFVQTVVACRQAAKANKLRVRTLVKRVQKCPPCSKCVHVVAANFGVFDVKSSGDILRAAYSLAALFEVPWVLGPLRVMPAGAIEITLGDGWVSATEDLLRALDAEVRLGAQEKVVNIAVEMLLNRRTAS